MERFDISGDPRLEALVEAVERGEEVAVTRDGRVVAEIVPVPPIDRVRPGKIDLEALRALRAKHNIRVDDAAALIREMRDMDDH